MTCSVSHGCVAAEAGLQPGPLGRKFQAAHRALEACPHWALVGSNPLHVWPQPPAPRTHDTDQGHITRWPPEPTTKSPRTGVPPPAHCHPPLTVQEQGAPQTKTSAAGPSSKSCGQTRVEMTQTHELRLRGPLCTESPQASTWPISKVGMVTGVTG